MLQDPLKVIPIILNRVVLKQENFLQKKDQMNKQWKETIEKNWYKSLDHQSFNFKAREKKITGLKNIQAEIKS